MGCVGCPLAGAKNQKKEFSQNRGIKKAIIKSCDKFLVANTEKRNKRVKEYNVKMRGLDHKKNTTNSNQEKKKHLEKMIDRFSSKSPFKNGTEMFDWWVSGLSIKNWKKEKDYQERLKKLF